LHEAELLAPLAKSCPGALLEESLDGSFAGAAGFAELRQGARVARVSHQNLGDPHRPRIGEVWKLQRHHLNRLQLIDNNLDQMLLSLRGLLQGMKSTGVENQFSQEMRHVDDAATSRESARQPWLQIESAHRHNSRHRNSVRHDRRYPDRANGAGQPRYRHRCGRSSLREKRKPAGRDHESGGGLWIQRDSRAPEW
jgi:hypothetical protein